MDPLRVLFVCTGNICRSPMAEGLARHHALQRGLALSCASVGLIARNGMPASEHGVSTLRAKGIDIGEHRAQAVRRALMLQGAGDAQLTTVSYGEERPAAEGSDEAAYEKNRRVELVCGR